MGLRSTNSASKRSSRTPFSQGKGKDFRGILRVMSSGVHGTDLDVSFAVELVWQKIEDSSALSCQWRTYPLRVAWEHFEEIPVGLILIVLRVLQREDASDDQDLPIWTYGGLVTSTTKFRRCQCERHTLFLAKLEQLSPSLFKFLVVRFISAAICAAVVSWSYGHGFGRFGTRQNSRNSWESSLSHDVSCPRRRFVREFDPRRQCTARVSRGTWAAQEDIRWLEVWEKVPRDNQGELSQGADGTELDEERSPLAPAPSTDRVHCPATI